MLVMKFGGTSVGSGERILHVAGIVLAHRDQQPVVITSAMSGVTDALLALGRVAALGDRDACESQFAALAQRHHDAALAINPEADWSALYDKLERLRATIEHFPVKQNPTGASSDVLVSWGERLAVTLVAGALQTRGQPALPWDAPIIATDEHALPLDDATRRLAEEALAEAGEGILVAPGFIARMPDGRITTLGRGGSDYSATLLAAALDADACWIYTDVDGLLSADPRIVEEAQILHAVSPRMAGRLSYSGAKVLHPKSVAPVARQGIPLRVRNTFRPEHLGTLIAEHNGTTRGAAQAITGRRHLAAIVFAGDGLPEVPHLFGRMCQAMTGAGIEMVLSVHPGTGYDPQIIVNAAQAQGALEQLTREFAAERAQGQISSIGVHEGLALCTLIGEELGSVALTQVQQALAAEALTPLVQTVGPAALSFVLHEGELERAIRSIHREVIEAALRQEALTVSASVVSHALDDNEESERRWMTSPS
ncbi:MAG TPA: aspartate kinase [Ktedonobacterales bacterium]|nr:aspartate kinase [Ktedonobacterales bacterium]